MSWLQELFDYDDYVELWTNPISNPLQCKHARVHVSWSILFGTLYMQGLPL